ncbi:MAG: hypothetical protein ACLT9M_05895 [Anaerobutyricum hallii]
MGVICWEGKTTNKNLEWKAEADNFGDLYNELIEREIIKNYDVDIYDEAVLSKYNKTEDDDEFLDENGEFDYDKIVEFVKTRPLTDRELWELIFSQKGNAYYQSFKREDNGELKEIDINDFEESGKYKW